MEKYDMIEEMGGGGTIGRTVLVWHKTEKKKYLLKKIKLVRPMDGSKQYFRREMALMSRIRNPYVVECKEAWIEKGCYVCIVTGYCEGGNMADIIKDANGSLFPEAKLCKWFAQLLIAMDYLHSNHILHQDLKCSNIFLTEDQDIRLGDFGLAKLLNDDDLTSLVGTPNYTCPELLANTPYSFKSDIWSLGCCMFEMASHQPAFRASDMAGLVSKINRSSIGALPSMYSSPLKSQIKSMLRNNPEHRPNAAELLKRPHLHKYLPECIVPPSPLFCPSPVRKIGNARRERDSLTISHYGGSLIKGKDSLFCSVADPRRDLHSADEIQCNNGDVFHPWPLNSSSDDASTTTDATKSDTQKEEERSLPNSSGVINSSRSDSAKNIIRESLSEVHRTFKYPQFMPPATSSGQPTMNCNASIQTEKLSDIPNADESKLPYKDSSADTEEYKCDNEIVGTKTYQERAEALESLLEMCAWLFEQQKLEELAGVLKPFGKHCHKASPSETVIWLTRTLKAINKERHNRDGFL